LDAEIQSAPHDSWRDFFARRHISDLIVVVGCAALAYGIRAFIVSDHLPAWASVVGASVMGLLLVVLVITLWVKRE